MKVKTVATALFIVLALVSVSGATTEIALLQGEIEVKGGMVRLGDVATISPRDANGLSQIPLLSAPPPGESREITKAHIEVMLERHGRDLDDISIRGEKVFVKTGAQVVKPAEILSAIESFIRMAAGIDEKLRVVITPTITIKELSIPKGEREISVESVAKEVLRGWFKVSLTVDGVVVKDEMVYATVQVERDVVVASRVMSAGHRIGEADVEVRRMLVGQREADALSEAGDVIGRICARAINSGSIIRRADLRLPIIIRRGDLVKIVARLGLITVSARGKALDSGRRGDLIRVENLGSGRKIEAEVISPGIAQVRIGGSNDVAR